MVPFSTSTLNIFSCMPAMSTSVWLFEVKLMHWRSTNSSSLWGPSAASLPRVSYLLREVPLCEPAPDGQMYAPSRERYHAFVVEENLLHRFGGVALVRRVLLKIRAIKRQDSPLGYPSATVQHPTAVHVIYELVPNPEQFLQRIEGNGFDWGRESMGTGPGVHDELSLVAE